jgi:hypothetical protein
MAMGAALNIASSAVSFAMPFGAGVASGLSSLASAAAIGAGAAGAYASFERRREDWEFLRTVAEQDVRIGAQQVKNAEDHLRVLGQEHVIAEMQAEHAKDTVEFLGNQFTNVELYDWMSGVLEQAFSYFLQQATAMAKLAERQLAFERQQIPPAVIQADYWEEAGDSPAGGVTATSSVDRRGRRALHASWSTSRSSTISRLRAGGSSSS